MPCDAVLARLPTIGDTRRKACGDTAAITPRMPALTNSSGICRSVSCMKTGSFVLSPNGQMPPGLYPVRSHATCGDEGAR